MGTGTGDGDTLEGMKHNPDNPSDASDAVKKKSVDLDWCWDVDLGYSAALISSARGTITRSANSNAPCTIMANAAAGRAPSTMVVKSS